MDTVSLTEMLDARERRSFLQQRLLQTNAGPLICLTLNIPGPVKVLPGVPDAFETGCLRILSALDEQEIPLLHRETIREKTGYEAFFSVDAPPETVKALMIAIEDRDRLGRVFDIDVLAADGHKLSREELGYQGRRCLLCGEPAHVCSRSRRHTVAELVEEITKILAAEEPPVLSDLPELFTHALLAEVSATPKPGLVDRHDSGAHTDMNYQTFVDSAHAIVPYLTAMARTGYGWDEDSGAGLFAAIRPMGIRAEAAMFAATGGVNTHKGMIFSMGTVAAAAGLYYRLHRGFSPEEILLLAGELCREELEKDFRAMDPSHPGTHGEQLYARYGSRGIRGEAQDGFPSIRQISLPALRQGKMAGLEDNPVYLNTLLALMSQVDDTNVLIRTSPELLAYEKAEAARILDLGGGASPEGLAALRELNERFIALNISPGGCADLLAVTILLWELEHYQEEKE